MEITSLPTVHKDENIHIEISSKELDTLLGMLNIADNHIRLYYTEDDIKDSFLTNDDINTIMKKITEIYMSNLSFDAFTIS